MFQDEEGTDDRENEVTWKRIDANGSSYHMNKVTLRVAAGRSGNPSMFWCLGRDVVKAGKLKFGDRGGFWFGSDKDQYKVQIRPVERGLKLTFREGRPNRQARVSCTSWPPGSDQKYRPAGLLLWGPLKGGGIEITLPPDFYEDWKYPDVAARDKVARLRVA